MTTRAAQAERTRQAVLDTARRLFLERGYDATSLQSIADAMGATKANVYYYFRTKLAILAALLDTTVDAVRALLDETEGVTGKRARIEYFVAGWVDQVVTATRTLAPMSPADPIMRRHPDIARRLDELAQRALRLLFGDEPSPDEVAAFWLLNDLRPAISRLSHLPDEELRKTLRRLCLRVLRT